MAQNVNETEIAQLLSLGIDPTFISFFPPTFVHPKLVAPDYVPPNRGSLILSFGYFTTIIASFALAARLSSRFLVHRRFGWDDWLIIAGWVCCNCDRER
jgi:hypothetical protein